MSTEAIRLERLLNNYGYIESRGMARAFLRENEVLHKGERVRDVTKSFVPRELTINGEAPHPEPGFVIMLHKPTGYECTHAGVAGGRVYDLLPAQLSRRKPQTVTVGRLDRDTSGLLLLTDDGQVVQRLTSPRHHVPKTYDVTLRDALRGTEAEVFAAGKLLLSGEEKPLLPARLEVTGAKQARLTIDEGRYHQVKRMFEAVENEVEALHRYSISSLTLGELTPGAWRYLGPEDMERLA
jgi:16S rRNA pseudouridine516 synthase